MLPTPQHGQFRWPQGGMEKGMCRVYAEGKMRVGVACKPGKWRTFSVGRGLDGVCAVGEWDSQQQEFCLFMGTSMKWSFLLMKGKYKKQTPLLGAAAAGTQYHPLFACGWWWSGGECKAHTHSPHILLFSSRIDVVTCCARSSFTSLTVA